METRESYRTSAFPDLSGRGAAAAGTLVVAGPLALLGAELAAYVQTGSGIGELLSRVAVPLMLAWAVVLFLITRIAAPLAAWTGLVAVTMQLTLVQGVTDGWLLLATETVGLVAFAIALWRVTWVPRLVPLVLLAFPLVDVFTPRHATLGELVAFAMFVAAGLVLSRAVGEQHGAVAQDLDEPDRCSPFRACSSGRACCEVRDVRTVRDPIHHLRMARPVG